MKKLLLILAILAFGGVTARPIMEFGYIGFFTNSITNSGNFQIFIDLVIANTLVMIWIWQDAPKQSLPRIPYLIFTVIWGSFGPLFYLLHREFKMDQQRKG